MNTVDCSLEGESFDLRPIEETAHLVLKHLELDGVELSILICNDDFIHVLNRDYRGKDKPTDVLSFSQREGGFEEDPMLGDVIISLETSSAQAVEHQKALKDELSLLLVHGILHLLGYDHEVEEEAEEMEAKEREILSVLHVEWELNSR
ncbi:MAG: rRNA maturation RNase YbeY [Myxococcota bacterium]|nr:rRNA maturation RNase YbeY [Myxococcota bacterium]